MAAKVNFDYTNKLIIVTEAPDSSGWVEIDVKIDIYSDGKEDWRTDTDLNKFKFPVRGVGGDDLPGEKSLGSTFFLDYGWRIRPYEDDHVLSVNGNLYTTEGESPFTQTVGSYNVMVINTVSSLVDSTVQQLAEIEYASFNGGVTVDVVGGVAGTDYPTGTSQEPSSNMTDALAIAASRGFTTFFIIGDITLDSGTDFDETIFVGESRTKSVITIDSDADVENCEFYDANVTGTLDGGNVLKNCAIADINYVNGYIEQCVLLTGTVTLGGSEEAHFLDCWSGVVGTATPIIDMGGSGQGLGVRNYNGGIELRNKTGSDKVSIDLNSGQVVLDSTVTAGEIVVRGIGKLTDNSVGATVNDDNLLAPSVIADAVWNHTDATFLLKVVKNKKSLEKTGSVWELIIYDDDDTTPILQKDLKDKDGNDITDLAAGVLAQELQTSV